MTETIAGRLIDRDVFPFPHPEIFFHRSWPIARDLRDRWEGLLRELAPKADYKQLHAARGDLLGIFDRYIDFGKSWLALLDTIEGLRGNKDYRLISRDELVRSIENLVQLRDDIFTPWQTDDDAADLLLKYFPLTNEQINAYCDRHPAPQAWYDDTFDPFTADE